MPFTPQEEEDLKARILTLEEERTKTTESLKGSATKAEISAALAPIMVELKDARKELAELKALRRGPGRADPDEPDDEDGDGWPFNMMSNSGAGTNE